MLFLFIFIRKNLESHRSRESESAGRGLRKQGQKKGFWSLGRREEQGKLIWGKRVTDGASRL